MLGENIGLLRVGYKANFFATDKDLLAIEPAGLEGMHARCLFMRGKRYTRTVAAYPLCSNCSQLVRMRSKDSTVP